MEIATVEAKKVRLYRCSCGHRLNNYTLEMINNHRASHSARPIEVPPKEPDCPKLALLLRKKKRMLAGKEKVRLAHLKRSKGSNKKRKLIRRMNELQQELSALKKKNNAAAITIKTQAAKPPGFYESRAWRELRYLVLKEQGRKCCLCGAIKTALHVDHIKPRSKYPHLALCKSNLQVLCADCNLGKSNKDETDWRPKSALPNHG